MTVRELILELQYEDQNAIVCVHNDDHEVNVQMTSIEFFEDEEYIDDELELRRGKIIVI
jgi:hypothetical protein